MSFVPIDTTQQRGVFVASNSQDSVEDIGFHIVDDTFPLKRIAESRKEVALSEEILQRYVGEYQLPDVNIAFTITRKGSRLFLQQTGEGRVGLFAEKETEFFLKVVDAAITFTKTESGNVNGLILHQKGGPIGKRAQVDVRLIIGMPSAAMRELSAGMCFGLSDRVRRFSNCGLRSESPKHIPALISQACHT